MRFLIIGGGSIGQRHIRNLKRLGHHVSVCEKDNKKGAFISKAYDIKFFRHLKEAIKYEYDAAFICTPTGFHIEPALQVAKRGINLFIEKPISHSLKGIKELMAITRKKRLVTLVGCNINFLPSFKLAKALIEKGRIGKILSVKAECGFYLPYWHPYEDYRKGYSAIKHLGGGVIFDDIHEIDALYRLFGDVKEVFCFADKISRLKIDTEDVAEILLKFKSGVIAQVHLDYIQRTYRKFYKFIGEEGIVIWDYINQEVKLYSRKTNQWKVFQESINTDREVMFIEEVKHFINCIKGKEKPFNDISKATDTLNIALACHKSARTKEIVRL